MHPVNKDDRALACEWDKIAIYRDKQIKNGLDLSFSSVLLPCILDLSKNSDFSNVLDAGCGTGYLTYEISKKAKKVVGVDFSEENILIAKKKCSLSNTEFVNTSIENYAKSCIHNYFSLCIANMTLMNVTSLDGVIKAISKLLKPNADFIFTITHPCYWPLYWNYFNKDWFDYKEEISIEAPFKITLDSDSKYVTTHFHRPLEMYIKTLLKYHFILKDLVEPIPAYTDQVNLQYKKTWKYPRFIGIKATVIK